MLHYDTMLGMGKYSHIWQNEELLRSTAASCVSIVDVLRALGVAVNNGNTGTLKQKCKQYSIDLPSDGQRAAAYTTHDKRRRTADEVLVNGCKIVAGSTLRKFMIAAGVVHQCANSDCGLLSTWRGKALTLQVDHADGDRFNNELSNLRFLCPNCHSQTETYAGRGSRREYLYCVNGHKNSKFMPVCATCEESFNFD